MRRFYFLFIFITYAMSKSFGFGEYESIGWWGSTTPAIVAGYPIYPAYNSSRHIVEQDIKNNKMGTKTHIEIVDQEFTITNSKYGKFSTTTYSLYYEANYKINNASHITYEIFILPNDDVLVTTIISTTSIDGYYKHEDKVVFPYGFPIVIEGATVPIRNTTSNTVAFILDCEKGYKVKNAFYFPDYISIISSTNGRIYFLDGKVRRSYGSEFKGYTDIACFNFNGTLLWNKQFNGDEYITALQETTNHLYIVGQDSDENGFYRILNANTGEYLKDYRETKSIYHYNKLKFEEKGFAYSLYDVAQKKYAGTKYISYDIIKEDRGLGSIVAKSILEEQKREETKKQREQFAFVEKKVLSGDNSYINELSNYYANGIGTEKNIAKAVDVYKNFLDKINDDGKYFLCSHREDVLKNEQLLNNLCNYYHPQNGNINEQWDALLCEAAATKGNKKAIYELVSRYSNGNCSIKNADELIDLLIKLANNGHTEAMVGMGELYLNLNSGVYDEAKGVEWYTKAYKAGNLIAKEKLGYFYLNGLHVKKTINWQRKFLKKMKNFCQELRIIRS